MKMAKKSNDPKILLDCDVIIHFIKAGKQLLLPKIFPERFVILDKVKAELDKHKSSKTSIDNFIAWSNRTDGACAGSSIVGIIVTDR